MTPLPPADFATRWRDTDIVVFAIGAESALSLATAASLLSLEETERAGRFHFSKDRDQWVRSRALLRLSLAHRLGVPPEGLVFQSGTCGKPSLSGYPQCHFNLSHSADFVAVAMSPEPVGIDIEFMRENLPVVSLAAHAFPPEETAAIKATPDGRKLFFHLWTSREAVMKCTGQGMTLPPLDISVSLENDLPRSATCSGGPHFTLLSLPFFPDYALTAARQVA